MHAVRSVLLALLAISCGSSEKPASTGPGPHGEGGGTAAAGAGPLTEADCERLLDHMLELLIADKKKTAKPDEVPTEEDVAKTRARMSAVTKDKCIGSPRAPYDCSMKAESTEQIRLCLEGKPQ